MPLFFQQTRFSITVANLAGLPQTTFPEIAFVGRSNAGKSSAINSLTHQKNLAFISKMPGRTQHLNFFEVIKQKEPVGYLVDLPGYGYAQTAKSNTRNWQEFLDTYLVTRPQLKGLVLVMDIRHPLTELDLKMIRWFKQCYKPIHIILTKADKLNKTEQQKTINDCYKKLEKIIKDVEIQLFSSTKKIGIENLSAKLQHLMFN